MRTVDIERTIPAHVSDVFEWLTDATNYRRISVVRRVTLVRPGDDHCHGSGAVRVVVTPLLRLTEEIVEYRPPTLMRYRITRSTPPLRHDEGFMAFRSVPEGTRVRWFSRFEVASPILAGVCTLAMVPVVAEGFQMTMDRAERELLGLR
ncbi:SRPBCC family protein [Nocardia xishanensis]|uniref:SRPBCC family protein n=1 Tax=Nocardia xishanensis TaxID=238964 RepID=UPI0008319FFB|nr:SRPBCC family protein [Nocardia xishanensis]